MGILDSFGALVSSVVAGTSPMASIGETYE